MAHEKLLRWQSWMDEEPGYGLWAIVPDGVPSPVGTALLAHLPDSEGEDTEDVEVGWHLHPDHWGHGYATEAAQRLMEHARAPTTSGLSAINALAFPGTDRSLGVMRRTGHGASGETDRWYGVQLLWVVHPNGCGATPIPFIAGIAAPMGRTTSCRCHTRGNGRRPA